MTKNDVDAMKQLIDELANRKNVDIRRLQSELAKYLTATINQESQ
jgi:hypothetical protein